MRRVENSTTDYILIHLLMSSCRDMQNCPTALTWKVFMKVYQA